MLEIIPGILEKDWNEIKRKIELVKPFAKTIHIDFLDGKFAPEISFLDPSPFSKYSKELILEAHLMVENPISYLESLNKAGFKRFIGQVEKMQSQEEFVAKGESLGEVGLALDSETEISTIKVPYEDLDAVLIMTVKAGRSGQSFDEKCLRKIEEIRQTETLLPMEVDGGINDQTLLLAKNAGAQRFISNSFLFGANLQDRYNLLAKSLQTQ